MGTIPLCRARIEHCVPGSVCVRMTSRPRLTALEIDAILAVAGNADADATVSDCFDAADYDKTIEAFETGMEKLRVMLNNRKR